MMMINASCEKKLKNDLITRICYTYEKENVDVFKKHFIGKFLVPITQPSYHIWKTIR